MSYKYIQRLAIQPGFREEEKLTDMVEFCTKAQIDDVMFFVNCEELNQGHLTQEETAPWMQLIARGKKILEPLGITTSINPWITLLHTDRGRYLKPGQNFNVMVDPYGLHASTVACPLCAEWRKYITDMYATYASIKPNMVWVEDDFRLHNHHPLRWGGCFCEQHLEEFSKRAGHKVAREDFLNGMLAPGDPHPYRQIWLDTARDTMAELAAMIGDAVHKVSPETRVGLMSSGPGAHCMEGRDWAAVLGGLSGPDVPMVNRPHLPAYQNVTGQQYLWNFISTSDLVRASVPNETEIYPEMEGFPPDTRYSKSHAFMRFQLETSLLIGSNGITLNIFDMMGNGAMLSDKFQDVLSNTKPFLNSLTDLDLKYDSRTGVKVLFDPKSSYTVRTPNGQEMGEIAPEESFWASMLSYYGIANRYVSGVVPDGEVVAVSGQYFRNLDASSLRKLFEKNFVILEAEAAWTLFEMGFGELAGIKNAQWKPADTGFHAYEQVSNGRTYCGLNEARLSTQISSGDLLDIEYTQQPELISMVKNPWNVTVANGCSIYAGRVFIFPYGRFRTGFSTHMHPVRQQILQETLKAAEKYAKPAFVTELPYINIQSHILDGKTVFVVTNFSDDDIEDVKCYLPGVGKTTAKQINRVGTGNIELCPGAEGLVSIGSLAKWETRALVFEQD